MNASRLFLLALAGLILAAIGSCYLVYPNYTHCYRLTVEVEADGEVRTGSGVVEVSWQRQPQILPQVAEWTFDVRGQAVPVDLGRHGLLLAVLWGSGPRELWGVGPPYLAMRAFAGKATGSQPLIPRWREPESGWYPPGDGAPAIARLPAGSRAALEAHNMPQLVWLPDPGDPATARPVPWGGLPAAVAPGVRLRGMWMEITRDRVTTDLSKRLPWLAEFVRTRRGRLEGGKRGDFILTPDTFTFGVEP